MERAHKYRIYPTKEQQSLIQKTFGCTRFVYNYFLAKRIELYQSDKKSLSFYDCSKELTLLKKKYDWLKEPDKFALQNALKDLDCAYQRFFNKNSCFPKFKSKKKNKKSYRTSFTNGNIEIYDRCIKLPKLGMVKFRDKFKPSGRILNATVMQNPSGKYFVSVCFTDVKIECYSETDCAIGLDLGLKEFVITSNGNKYKNPRYLNSSLKKLAMLQRSLSRKTRGSGKWNKARLRLARCYEHVKNQRTDYLQKLSTNIIKENDVICLESLNVENMLKNHNLARSISDASWSEFVSMLEYKAAWHDKTIIKIDTFYPSSQLCSVCGEKNPETKDLSVREWTCQKCGTTHDRDINAATNILVEGLRILQK